MSDAAAQMPRYKCHKEVYALQIATVERRPFGNAGVQHTLTFKEAGYAPLDVGLDYIEKHNPHQGGYYVVYDDGYKSFSPAKAFEEGYTRVHRGCGTDCVLPAGHLGQHKAPDGTLHGANF